MSMASSGTISSRAPHRGHFQRWRTTMKAREVVTAIVPLTASPKAWARLEDDLNTAIRNTTPIKRKVLICGR